MAPGKKKTAKIVVKRDLCIGAGSCVAAADSVFELDGENKAVMKQKGGKKDSGPVLKKDLEAENIPDEKLVDSAESCPTRAIFLYGEGGEQIYP